MQADVAHVPFAGPGAGRCSAAEAQLMLVWSRHVKISFIYCGRCDVIWVSYVQTKRDFHTGTFKIHFNEFKKLLTKAVVHKTMTPVRVWDLSCLLQDFSYCINNAYYITVL